MQSTLIVLLERLYFIIYHDYFNALPSQIEIKCFTINMHEAISDWRIFSPSPTHRRRSAVDGGGDEAQKQIDIHRMIDDFH